MRNHKNQGEKGRFIRARETTLGKDYTKEKIKERIIRRVYEIIDTCNDPKKLMDTYEAISKFQKESGQNRESIFEMIEKKLEEK